MELEQYNPDTDSWERVEVKDEETQIIYDTMLAEMEIQEVIDLMKEQMIYGVNDGTDWLYWIHRIDIVLHTDILHRRDIVELRE